MTKEKFNSLCFHPRCLYTSQNVYRHSVYTVHSYLSQNDALAEMSEEWGVFKLTIGDHVCSPLEH